MHAEVCNLVLCVVAVIVAGHAPPEHRRVAVALAAGCLANWLFCGWTYRAPVLVQRHAIELWTMADAAVGMAAVTLAHRFWLGWAVWAVSIVQVGFHLLHAQMADAAYLFWLDKLLLAQLACFLMVGGNGVRDRLSAGVDLRRLVRAPRARPQP